MITFYDFSSGSTPDTIEIVGYRQYQWGNSAQTVTIDSLTGGLASTPSEGDYILMCAGTSNAALIIPALTVDPGFSPLAALSANDTNDTGLRVYGMFMPSGSLGTITWAGSGSSVYTVGLLIVVLRNVQSVAVQTATGGNTGKPNPPAIVPADPGSILCCYGVGGHNSFDAASSTMGLSGLTDTATRVRNGFQYAWSMGLGFDMAPTIGASNDPAVWTHTTDDTAWSWAAVTMAISPTTA